MTVQRWEGEYKHFRAGCGQNLSSYTREHIVWLFGWRIYWT